MSRFLTEGLGCSLLLFNNIGTKVYFALKVWKERNIKVSFSLTGNLAKSFFNQLSFGSGFFVIKINECGVILLRKIFQTLFAYMCHSLKMLQFRTANFLTYFLPVYVKI